MISMRSSLRAAAAVTLVCAAGLAQAQAYVSGSVSGQLAPGVYGRVDIGNAPPPLLYQQPMLIAPPAVMVPQRPVYMWVPPGHARDWRRYCGRYNACGQSVYFLRNPPPNWHARDDGPRGNRPSGGAYFHDREDDRGHGRGDRHGGRENGHGGDRGHGGGHGGGHGRGRD
jgi:uncharacterized membrane protein YgcG